MTIPPQIVERMAQRIREVVADDWSGVPEPARECAVCYHAAREALSGVLGLPELIEAAMDYSVAGFKVASKRHLVQAAIAFARANGGDE